jgi:transglutaminase-like putative cysteine protease
LHTLIFMKKFLILIMGVSFFIGFQINQSGVCSSKIPDVKSTDNPDEIKRLALKVAGSGGSDFERAVRLTEWVNREFAWIGNDYKQRSVEEIIKRRAGQCGEQARVLKALFTSINIKCRDIREINIQPANPQRQSRAEQLVKQNGLSASVFGLQHNDHRWLEVYNEDRNRWEPFDSTTGLIGTKNWLVARVSFLPRPEIAKDLLIPESYARAPGQGRLERLPQVFGNKLEN